MYGVMEYESWLWIMEQGGCLEGDDDGNRQQW